MRQMTDKRPRLATMYLDLAREYRVSGDKTAAAACLKNARRLIDAVVSEYFEDEEKYGD